MGADDTGVVIFRGRNFESARTSEVGEDQPKMWQG